MSSWLWSLLADSYSLVWRGTSTIPTRRLQIAATCPSSKKNDSSSSSSFFVSCHVLVWQDQHHVVQAQWMTWQVCSGDDDGSRSIWETHWMTNDETNSPLYTSVTDCSIVSESTNEMPVSVTPTWWQWNDTMSLSGTDLHSIQFEVASPPLPARPIIPESSTGVPSISMIQDSPIPLVEAQGNHVAVVPTAEHSMECPTPPAHSRRRQEQWRQWQADLDKQYREYQAMQRGLQGAALWMTLWMAVLVWKMLSLRRRTCASSRVPDDASCAASLDIDSLRPHENTETSLACPEQGITQVCGLPWQNFPSKMDDSPPPLRQEPSPISVMGRPSSRDDDSDDDSSIAAEDDDESSTYWNSDDDIQSFPDLMADDVDERTGNTPPRQVPSTPSTDEWMDEWWKTHSRRLNPDQRQSDGERSPRPRLRPPSSIHTKMPNP